MNHIQQIEQVLIKREQPRMFVFRYELAPEEIDKIRKATNGNFALGNNRFKEEIGEMLGRRVTPGKAGRPRNKNIDK